MKKNFIHIFILVFMVSCYDLKGPKKPDDLLSKSEMTNIIFDLKVLASINGENAKVLDSNNINVNTYVFMKYNIDSVRFAKSNNYYAYNIEDYEEIYQNVNDSLQKLNEYYKEQQGGEAKEIEDYIKSKKKELNEGLVTPVSDN